MEVYTYKKRKGSTARSFKKMTVTVSPALFPAVTVTVVRDRKIWTALRINHRIRYRALLERK